MEGYSNLPARSQYALSMDTSSQVSKKLSQPLECLSSIFFVQPDYDAMDNWLCASFLQQKSIELVPTVLVLLHVTNLILNLIRASL